MGMDPVRSSPPLSPLALGIREHELVTGLAQFDLQAPKGPEEPAGLTGNDCSPMELVSMRGESPQSLGAPNRSPTPVGRGAQVGPGQGPVPQDGGAAPYEPRGAAALSEGSSDRERQDPGPLFCISDTSDCSLTLDCSEGANSRPLEGDPGEAGGAEGSASPGAWEMGGSQASSNPICSPIAEAPPAASTPGSGSVSERSEPESCTGGLVAARLVDFPGISSSLREAHVTYANEAKIRYCGVSPETLAAHGAVSPEVAREMAEGLRARSGADIIAIDGFRGGTGAAPTRIRDNVGIPIELALASVDQRLRDEGIRNNVSLVVGGSVRSAADVVKAVALGADAVYVATAALLALGCHLCRTCQSGLCNWGIATQREDLVKRLNPDMGSQRLVNLMSAWRHEIKELMGGMGINSIESLRGNRLMLRGVGLTEKELEILGISHAGE